MRNDNAATPAVLQGASEVKSANFEKPHRVSFSHSRRSQMKTFKLLSAALITASVLASPAMARKSQVNSRQVASDISVTAPGMGSIDERVCHRAPAVGAFAGAPWAQPPCEPSR
jgi:hypothetical protein